MWCYLSPIELYFKFRIGVVPPYYFPGLWNILFARVDSSIPSFQLLLSGNIRIIFIPCIHLLKQTFGYLSVCDAYAIFVFIIPQKRERVAENEIDSGCRCNALFSSVIVVAF